MPVLLTFLAFYMVLIKCKLNSTYLFIPCKSNSRVFIIKHSFSIVFARWPTRFSRDDQIPFGVFAQRFCFPDLSTDQGLSGEVTKKENWHITRWYLSIKYNGLHGARTKLTKLISYFPSTCRTSHSYFRLKGLFLEFVKLIKDNHKNGIAFSRPTIFLRNKL